MFNDICTYYARIKMNIYPIVLDKKTNKLGKVNIKIRIIHRRKVRDIGTDFYIDPNFWTSDAKVDNKYENADYLNFEISKKILGYQERILKINYRSMNINEIVAFLRTEEAPEIDLKKNRSPKLIPYYKKIIEEKTRVNKRTGEIYAETLVAVERFAGQADITFEEITAGWLRRFVIACYERDNKKDTIRMHLRNIRHVFNCAIDEPIIPLGIYPFRRFIMPKGTTERVPLSLDQLKKLISLRFENEAEERARLAFLLSFVMIGINNSDIYKLPSDAIVDGRVYFSRNKTSKDYSIKIEPEITEYIELQKGSVTLVNFADHYKSPRAFTKFINKKLKDVGKEIGALKLIMYIARHTWAALAKNELGIDDNDISAALGHSIKGVTQGYTHRRRELVDQLNRQVLDLVFKPCPPRTPSKTRYKNRSRPDRG